MRLYWWNERPNLGDSITAIILRQLGHEPKWSPVSSAEWVGIGSLLELFDGFNGTVWGTGRAGPSAPPTDLRAANVLALRGRETAALAKCDRLPVLGDPGLLATEVVPKPEKEYGAKANHVIVPHWSDQERMLATYPGAILADVTGDPVTALRTIATADYVISSSLHGLVFADAYGVPRMWDWFERTQARGFKFRDYFTVMGLTEPGRWVTAKATRVHAIRSELKDVLDGA